MSDDRRISADEARALRDAATPGPWGAYRPAEFHDDWRIAYIGKPKLKVTAYVGRIVESHLGDGPPSAHNVKLIVAAPVLCDTVIALHADVARLTEALRRSREAHAIDLHALAEYLTLGAAPAEVSGDAVIEAAEAMHAEVEHLRARRGAALEELDRLRDDPALDATDGAHPAWWRGHDRAAEMLAAQRDAAIADARQWRERYDAIVTAVREMLAAERAVADELLTDGSDNLRADLAKMFALRCRAHDARRALRALVEAP